MARVPGGFGVKRPDRSVSLGFAGDVAADPLSYLGSAGASGRRGPALGRPVGVGAGGAGTGFGPQELLEAVQMLVSDYQDRRAAQAAGERKHTYGPDSDPFSEAIGGGLKAVGRGLGAGVGAVDRAGERIGETMQDWERSLGDALFSAIGGVGDAVGSVKGITKDALMGIIRDYSDRRNEQHRGERKHTYGSDAWHGF